MLNVDSNSNFVIISGVHKAGTTSLFRYLIQHPNIVGSSIKETHFFTPIRFGKQIKEITAYFQLFTKTDKTEFLLEASPSYFYGGNPLSTAILEKLNHNTRSILILRNPTDRFISFYKHGIYTLTIEKDTSLMDFTHESIKQSSSKLEDTKISRGIREGFYIDYLSDWHNAFKDNLKIIFFDDFKQHPEHVCKLIFDWLKIDSNEVQIDYKIENKTLAFKNKQSHNLALIVNQYLEKTFNQNQKLKSVLRKIYQFINTSKAKIEISEDCIELLNATYLKKNIELGDYLIRHNIVKESELPEWIRRK